jgi:hypothetical protein
LLPPSAAVPHLMISRLLDGHHVSPEVEHSSFCSSKLAHNLRALNHLNKPKVKAVIDVPMFEAAPRTPLIGIVKSRNQHAKGRWSEE